MSRRRFSLVLALLAAVVATGASPAGATASHSRINGSGSSWSSNAVNQWVADVQPNGLEVVFTANGSAVGRKDFANNTTDFAVSDIGYQGNDSKTGESDTAQGRAFVYLPIVAGGTGFPYHVKVAGKLVRNLRLSGLTLAKIFTNQITNWNDGEITKDNNGRALPSKPIIPVVHSEGSGSSAQFTRYLDSVFPNLWRPFLGKAGPTEYFPRKGNAIAQDGSDGVMNYVASDAADGAIGFDEYSYALGKNYPVAKIENVNHYFTLPKDYNVAVALTSAQINLDKKSPNYLLQDLSKVYAKPDNRSYPLSSYSYMIIPTGSADPRMTTAKRQTIADYLYYSICDGQKEMGPIGYSPLPINLAQASFDQVNKLKTADAKVDLTRRDISTCGNPTFVAGHPELNHLAQIAPQPPACDAFNAGPCADGGTTSARNTGGGTGVTPGGSKAVGGGGTTGGTSGTTGTGTSGTNGTGKTGATGTVAAGTTGGKTGSTPGDPLANQPGGSLTGTSSDLAGVPTELASGRSPVSSALLGPLAILLLIAAVVAPPVLSTRLRRDKG